MSFSWESVLDRLHALNLLSECMGDCIWSLEHCQLRRIPQSWIDELSDCFESGFRHDSQTIYVDADVVNQYQGIRDVDLAFKLAEFLDVNTRDLQENALSRSALVNSIRERVEEG